jgi:hypothetical protein
VERPRVLLPTEAQEAYVGKTRDVLVVLPSIITQKLGRKPTTFGSLAIGIGVALERATKVVTECGRKTRISGLAARKLAFRLACRNGACLTPLVESS